jgi:hypothetical protein
MKLMMFWPPCPRPADFMHGPLEGLSTPQATKTSAATEVPRATSRLVHLVPPRNVSGDTYHRAPLVGVTPSTDARQSISAGTASSMPLRWGKKWDVQETTKNHCSAAHTISFTTCRFIGYGVLFGRPLLVPCLACIPASCLKDRIAAANMPHPVSSPYSPRQRLILRWLTRT